MRKPLIPLFLGVLAQACALAQTPQSFTAQAGFQSWTVPATGWYDLTVSGAQGGTAGSHSGGKGATIETSVRLVQGEQLEIVVGSMGAAGSVASTNDYSGGGGGGYSSIIKKTSQGNIRLVIAGGGGGAGSAYNGDGGRADNWAPTFGGPAIAGNGGVVTGGKFSGAGGGGFFADGSWAYDGGTNQTAAGGKSYTSTSGPSGGSTAVYTTSNNLHAGGAGGWGGGGQGGAATGSNDGAGAGGGGYSGGGGGPNSGNGGAGGGSWVPEDNTIAGARQESGQPIDANVKANTTSRRSGDHAGNGAVTITLQRYSLVAQQVSSADTSTAVFNDSFKFPGDVSRVSLGGNATSASDYVELTPAASNQTGTMVISTLPAQQKVSRLVAKFEVQLTGGSTPPADGFGFNFGPSLTTSTSMAQNGAAHGLSVTFDSFDNGSSDTAPAVEVVYEGAVKGGVSLFGTRSGGRAFAYPCVEDANLNSPPMTTDSSGYSGYNNSWVPVEVELVSDVTGASTVNVTWNGLRILQNVSVPYAPSKSDGWNIGFGASTGGYYQAQRVRNVSLAAWTYVSVNVTSNFGQNLVSPPVGSTTYQTGSSPVFTAPQYVYLDRYGKTLSGTDDEMRLRAAYRATRLGGTINGQPLQNGAAVKLTQDSVVNWDWQLEYLAEVNTGTQSIQTADGKGISASSVTDSANQGTLGRNWRPLNYNFNSVVFSSIMPTGTGLDIQFLPKGYVIENAPSAPERFLQLSGGISGAQDHLRADLPADPGMIGGDGSFTIEFWARRDPVTMTADQNVVALGSDTSATKQLRAGFTSGKGFFITNNGVTVAAAAGLTDESWHHWAAVNDKTANTVTIYRDGKVVQTGSQALTFSGSSATVTIGARANGANAEGFFPGGINNVRVWKTALSISQVRGYLATMVVGAGNPSLGLELPFDTLPNVDTAGVYLERRKGTPKPTSVADTASFAVESSTTSSDFSLPAIGSGTGQVPLATSSGYYGWTLRSRLTIDKGKAGTYSFQVINGDGFQLFIDGTRVGDTDTPPLVATRALDEGEHVIEFQAYETGTATNRPTIMYSSADAGLPSMIAIPSSNLHLLARDLFTMRPMTIASTEGANVSFTLHGAESLFAAPATGAQIVASMMPGFHYNAVPGSSGSTQNIDPAEQGSISNYRRVFWMWDKTFHYTVDVSAVGLLDGALTALTKLPFFRTVNGSYDSTNIIQSQTAAGVLRVLDIWLPEGEKLEVGHIHRTPDRRYTFTGVQSAMNNFSNLNLRALANIIYNGQHGRSMTFTAVSGPGSVTLVGGTQTYRARLAIGEGLDFSSTASMNSQLTPMLPDTAVLASVTANSRPSVTPPDTTSDPAGYTSNGDAWQWDTVGKKWYPLRPGVYTIMWRDTSNNGGGYDLPIEVTVDFPNVQKTIQYWENQDGDNVGPVAYTFDPTTNPQFPGAPGAHYRYLISPVAASPFPVDLDPSAADRWTFLRQAFSEQSTATVDKTGIAGPRFTETSSGIRTVHVFSYLPGSGVATGDLNKEQIAVRVVSSMDWQSHNDSGLALTVAQAITPAQANNHDTASYGSGYIVNEISNYNASIYNRKAAVGKWGAIYPVNHSCLFQDESRKLKIGYYENPGSDATSTLHPPVGWPYVMTTFSTVAYPAEGGDANAIYIASQLGSEGVNQNLDSPKPQTILDPAKYANLTVYNQPNRDLPGYNPNEEHAIVAPSNLAAMTGDNSKSIGQSAFFALQNLINRTNTSHTDRDNDYCYTSDPFVLGQYTDPKTGQPGMIAYRVLTTRGSDNDGKTTPFPARDASTHLPVDGSGNPVAQPVNPRYTFDTVIFAGDLVTPFYPLNIVMGGRVLPQNTGNNVDYNQNRQQTLWLDKNQVPWAVAGDFPISKDTTHAGMFNYRFWYPLVQGFWLGEGTKATGPGTPVCWLPEQASADGELYIFTQTSSKAQSINYNSYWRDNYPVLKRGETLAYAGGEYKADHPTAPGLPAVINWASAEVAFDSATPDMAINDDDLTNFNARFMRLLDVRSVGYTKEQMPDDLTPQHTDKVSVSGARWYFKDLSGSLSQGFYYDTLSGQLVFRGSVNGVESGDPALAASPLTVTQVLPNVLTQADMTTLVNLAPTNTEWVGAIQGTSTTVGLFQLSNPVGYDKWKGGTSSVPLGLRLAGSGETQLKFVKSDNTEEVVSTKYRSLKSLGTGAMLVPNPASLTDGTGVDRYVTIVENNDTAAGGAVTLHVIRMGDERYRGAVSVITPKDAFDEKVELTHSGDFGGDTGNLYYQWWVRDVAPLDGLPTPDQSTTSWTIYKQGKGLNRITFAGDPTMTLADKLIYVRYGHANELSLADSQTHVDNGGVLDTAWRLVDPDASSPDWSKGSSGHPAPYQWAGAANSPQLQASGAHRFLPQLLMGWVKRVLDAVNPYEARYSADFNGDAPPTGSSMLGQAGRPYNGPVALNSSRGAIESVGLIELYETVLQRARDLSGTTNDAGINQALLLAATRLSSLYELVGGEAYTDALNPSLSLTTAGSDNAALNFAQLSAANPYIFAFMNEVPSLLQEELALLRGTDYLKSYPVQNRLFWNYFKGLGEAAYNANYNIGDSNRDGLIDETDAALTYPMGHGDAWGHFLSAIKMHYGLLQRSNYDWQARAELYSLLGNVIPTDYLDEQSFARVAATRARCGLSIVKATYRDAYDANPATQWQGYTDSADPARAWGMSEWANRSGQGAVFDWMIGNAILPAGSTDPATGKPLEGLNLINRQTSKSDLQALAGTLREIQQALDAANQGLTPIGVDPDSISFGLDSFYDGSGWERKTHFQQTYDSAVAAASNARAALDFVSATSQTMRQIGNDAGALKQQAIEQDINYRNSLIGLLGTPYNGTIGAGQIYQDGYSGPDLLTYMYLDATSVEQIQPSLRDPETGALKDGGLPDAFTSVRSSIQNSLVETGSHLSFFPTIGMTGMTNDKVSDLFKKFYLSSSTQDSYPRVIVNGFSENTDGVGDNNKLSVDLPVISKVSQYAFKARNEWGQRSATGEIQNALGEMLQSEVALETAIDDYQVYLNKLNNLATFADQRLQSLNGTQQSRQLYLTTLSVLKDAFVIIKELKESKDSINLLNLRRTSRDDADITKQDINMVGGTLPSMPVLLGLMGAHNVVAVAETVEFHGIIALKKGLEIAIEQAELLKDNDKELYSEFNELIELLKELSNELQEDPSKRLNMAAAVQALNLAGAKVRSLEAQANRLVAERAAANKMIAGRAQANRYGDMIARLSRDDAARKYESAMDTAVRFAWLAAKAYDYETSLSPGHPANAATLLEDLMKVRQLGQWDGDTPRVGNGGLADVLAKLKANYDFLGGNIGLNNPQWETSNLSLRKECKRILDDGGSLSKLKWQSYLASTQVADLNSDFDFTHYCRPFASNLGPAQPGFKIEFSTEINPGRNLFGNPLSALDHAFSTANFATKLRSVGVGFSGYDVSSDGKQRLSATPRVYFVPAGLDIMRYSDGLVPKTRGWNVIAQRIPVPFPINGSNLRDYAFNPAVDSLNGRFADLARLGDFRAYPTSGGALSGSDPAYADPQLFSRSVWNTRWILFVPAATLGSDQKAAMKRFIETVTDIQLQFVTFSSYGM